MFCSAPEPRTAPSGRTNSGARLCAHEQGGEPIRDLTERLLGRGWRLTPQRRAVCAALRGENVHLSAEMVLELARTELPKISVATVYNTLHDLVEMGEIVEVVASPGPRRYDPNAVTPHHHLVCTSCGSLTDVDESSLGALRDLDTLNGFVIESFDVVFRGRCPACNARAAAGEVNRSAESTPSSPPGNRRTPAGAPRPSS